MSDAVGAETPEATEVDRPTIGHRVEYVALRAAIAVASRLPLRAAGSVGDVVGRLAYGSGFRRRVVAQQVAASFPDLDAAARRRIAIGAYTNLGRVLIETAVIGSRAKGAVVDVFHAPTGWEHVTAPLAARRGVILVGGHLGNWELGAAYMNARGIPVAGVVRRMRNPLFEAYLTQTRERLGSRVIPDRDAVRAIPRLIASAHVIPMLADQGVKGLASTFVPFFGRLARTPKGPAVLALRLEAACVLFVSVREPDGKYRLHFEPVPMASTGDRERDVDAIVAAYTRQLESWVRRYPEQYMWQHRRWRRRPDGSLDEESLVRSID